MSIDIATNNSFCPYPFTHSYIGPQYERKLCCISDDLPGLSKIPLEEFWNSEKMRDVRKQMVAGEEVKECSRCYQFEAVGVPSLRQESTKYADPIRLLNEYDHVTGALSSPPDYFDHRTIHCNLQCVSCGSEYSSSHIILKEKMYDQRTSFIIDPAYEKQCGDDIIQSINRKECKSIYWAGGEPMMSSMHWAVIEEMNRLAKLEEYTEYLKHLGMHYNTNLSRSAWKGKLIPDLLEPFQPSIQASIDGTHETFEYTRDGASWSITAANWNAYYAKLNKNQQFGVASVLSSPVLMDIDRWFDFFEPYNIKVHNHKHITESQGYPHGAQCMLDIRLFPKHIFDRVIDHAIDRFSKTNLIGAEKSIVILESYVNERQSNSIFDDEDMIRIIKTKSQYRDKFLRSPRTYEEVLKIIDPEAYDWYMSL